MTKAEDRRRLLYPLKLGVHRIEEYAFLRIADGKTDTEIAALWGLRPRSGPDDLYWDVCCLWKESGCPFGLPVPDIRDPDTVWAPWREARETAIPQWLRSLIEQGEPLQHCATCTCRRPIDLPGGV